MKTFEELGLSEEILKVLSELGFENPTEIQEQAIPELLVGHKDMIGLAQTGTGKTAAFGLPLLERIDTSNKSTQGLILAPTRELGKQIAEQLEIFSKYMKKLNVLAVYGGAYIGTQLNALKKTQHIIIATPGRLIDLIKRKAVKLEHLEFLVLDEADEMLNMGFKEDLEEIMSYAPAEKMTWLFSATMPSAIKRIVKNYMEDPVEIKVNQKNEVNVNIKHVYAMIRQRDKSDALTRFLDLESDMRGVVFCRTKRDTQELAEQLLKRGYKADALHGDLSQAQRDRVMKRFKKHDLKVLIATDVAARGIDVNDLTHVFHYTLPDDMSYYTHRSGRTARAGKKGTSIVFINGRELYRVNRLERSLGIKFEKVMVPDVEEIINIRIKNWCLEVLGKEPKENLDEDLMDSVNMIFANLTKEELLAKLLSGELEKLNIKADGDLNDQASGGRGGGRRERGGGRGYGGRSGGRDYSRGRRDSRSGGRSSDRRDRDSSGGGSERRERKRIKRSETSGGGYKKGKGKWDKDSPKKERRTGKFAKKAKAGAKGKR